MHKIIRLNKDFSVGPAGNRMLDRIIITWGLKKNIPWVMCRRGQNGGKDRGPLWRLQGDPGDR